MINKERKSSNRRRLASIFAGILCLYVTNVKTAAVDVSYNYKGNEWTGLCATGKR